MTMETAGGVCGCLMRTTVVLLLSFSPAGWSSAEAAGAAGFISKMFSLIMFGASGHFVLFVCLYPCLCSVSFPSSLSTSCDSYSMLVS